MYLNSPKPPAEQSTVGLVYGPAKSGSVDKSKPSILKSIKHENPFTPGCSNVSLPERSGNGEKSSKSEEPNEITQHSLDKHCVRAPTMLVGNLPYNFREWDVDDMFALYGRLIKITVPMNCEVDHNKGFAYVQFENLDEGKGRPRSIKAALLMDESGIYINMETH